MVASPTESCHNVTVDEIPDMDDTMQKPNDLDDTSEYNKSPVLDYATEKTYDNSISDKSLGDTIINIATGEQPNVNQLMRTSTWINTFFLIVTDILGPSQVPYSFAALGYVPGTLMYFKFGALATYAGVLLLKLYVHYDTDARPCRTYGDIAQRIFEVYGFKYGIAAKYYSAFFQIFQLWMNVAIIILSSGQALYQISNNSVCFLVMTAAFCGAGILCGLIKQLHNLSYLANTCIWLNIFTCIATLAVASYTPALTNIVDAAPSSVFQSGYIPTDANGNGLLAATGVAFTSFPFAEQMNGVTTMVYAYGGATIFVELMAEMKNANDFKKSLYLGMTLIISCYFAYGIALYALQGPYVANPGNQGISPYAWQTALNALTLYFGLIAAVLYGNIGMKVVYVTLCQDIMGLPALSTRKGNFNWYILVTVYWLSAFVVCEAAPQLNALGGLTAALGYMHFSYIFPPLFHLMYQIQHDGTWKEALTRQWYWKLFDLIFCLGAVALMGIGSWAGIEVLLASLAAGGTEIFGCNGP